MKQESFFFSALKLVAICTVLLVPSTSPAAQEDLCKVDAVRSDALSFPSRHAWNLFIMLQHPARTDGFVRGEPDCSAPFGSPGRTSVWESWRLASHEVLLSDGSEPPEWNDTSLPTGGFGATPDEEDTFHSPRNFVAFDVEEGVFENRGGFGETRMNRATYEFIKDNCLWSREGLLRYAEAVISGKKPPVDFPIDSIEVKTAWLEFSEAAITTGDPARYYTAEHDGKLYGLTSIHILTKDIPKWFWATFHHKDAPENQFELPDDYGPPQIVQGTVWENYVLGGTQTDFVDTVGKPIILSDHYIEFGFQRSSCITCHSQASSNLPPTSGPPRQTTDVGVPNPRPYFDDDELTRPKFIHTDFVWSIPFRVQPESSPPPERCIW